MRGFAAQQGLGKGFFLAISLAGALTLGACTDIDNMFGDDGATMGDQLAPPDAGGAAPTAGSTAAYAPPAASSTGLMAPITPVRCCRSR